MSNDNYLCLDFANTLEMHASDHPQETLHNYADLVAWAEDAGILTSHKTKHLLEAARGEPTAAHQVLGQALGLREVIYRIFAALALGVSPENRDLVELNTALSTAMDGAQIIQIEDGFQWIWNQEQGALDSILHPIVRSAAKLLTSDDLRRVGQCADDRGCGWLFIDTSKNRSRRWCSMVDCGNRAKQRRHYQSKRGQ